MRLLVGMVVNLYLLQVRLDVSKVSCPSFLKVVQTVVPANGLYLLFVGSVISLVFCLLFLLMGLVIGPVVGLEFYPMGLAVNSVVDFLLFFVQGLSPLSAQGSQLG